MSPRRCVGTLALIVTTMTPLAALAATGERPWLRQTVDAKPAEHADHQSTVSRWGAALLLVGLSSFALWKGLRRKQSLPSQQNSAIHVGSVTRLSPKAHLVVVSVNGRELLLAVTDTQVTRLALLDQPMQSDESEASVNDTCEFSRNEQAQPANAPANDPSRFQAVTTSNSGRAAATKLTSDQRTTSRFRDILSDIIGIDTAGKAPAQVESSAAEALAATTVDHYTPRSPARGRSAAGAPATVAMVNFEGQAAGLIARLNRTQS